MQLISRPASSNSHCNRIRSATLQVLLKSALRRERALHSIPLVVEMFPELSIVTKNLKRTDSPKMILIVDMASSTLLAPSG